MIHQSEDIQNIPTKQFLQERQTLAASDGCKLMSHPYPPGCLLVQMVSLILEHPQERSCALLPPDFGLEF